MHREVDSRKGEIGLSLVNRLLKQTLSGDRSEGSTEEGDGSERKVHRVNRYDVMGEMEKGLGKIRVRQIWNILRFILKD